MAVFEIAAAVAAVAALASAAASAYAQNQAGKAQAGAARYQSRVSENQALAARQAAQVAEQQSRARTDRIKALARARAEASGIMSAEGSPLLVQMENARQAELEAQMARYEGEVQGGFFESESKLQTFRGRVARRGANIGAGTTLLAGVASAASYGANAYRPSTTRPTGGGGYSSGDG